MITNLVEFGTTFFVGVFILIGSWLLLCVVFRLRSPFGVKINYWISTLFAVSGLALGVVFENVSDKFVDEEDRWYSWLLRDDAELKFESVFEVSDTDLPKPADLAKELATHHLFEQTNVRTDSLAMWYVTDCQERTYPPGTDSFAQRYVTDCQEWEYPPELDQEEKMALKKDVEKQLTKAVRLTYYHARNRTLRETTYFEELTAIQRRIDFSRTCALIAFLLIPACALLVLLRVILHAFNAFDDFVGSLRDLLPPGWIETAPANEPNWRWWSRAGLLAVVSLFIYVGAATAYAIEEDQFDKRAFGYYLSILDSAGKADGAIVDSPASKKSPFGGPYGYDAGEQKLINFGVYKQQKLYLTRQATLTKKLFLRSVQANMQDHNGKLFQRYNYVVHLDGTIKVAVWKYDWKTVKKLWKARPSERKHEQEKKVSDDKLIMVNFYPESPERGTGHKKTSLMSILIPQDKTDQRGKTKEKLRKEPNNMQTRNGLLDAMSKHFMLAQPGAAGIESFSRFTWWRTKVAYAGEILVDVGKRSYILNSDSGTYKPDGAYLEAVAGHFEKSEHLGIAPQLLRSYNTRLREYSTGSAQSF